jgi:hypothetical protein
MLEVWKVLLSADLADLADFKNIYIFLKVVYVNGLLSSSTLREELP